jgi:glucose-6-phosphate dehydrogenase assembly protein OpcA
MILDLVNTTAAKINGALLDARRRSGSPAMGMVLTLVISTDEGEHYDALRAATDAAREHPSRILVAIRRPGSATARLDAEVRVGETGPGEVVLLRMHGALSDHADSVVLPLLLPDAPVVIWWTGTPPRVPAQDNLGALAQRRITDAAASEDPMRELHARAAGYRPGDTDLSWTRLTSWRTLLAATLDEPYGEIRAAHVAAEKASPSARLLALWLGWRLDVPVTEAVSNGPGITDASLETVDGPIAVTRPDGRLAALVRPRQPERTVALPRRSTAELLAEELRRLDPDETYGATLALLESGPGGGRRGRGEPVSAGRARGPATPTRRSTRKP